MSKKLAGKVALVTGGSRGIGAEIARRLAEEGAAVAITYSQSPDKAAAVVKGVVEAGGKAVALQADGGDAAAVRSAVSETVKTHGCLDILVNNAGMVMLATVDKVTVEDFDRIMAVNVRGVFVATQEAARHMVDGGRVINIGSINSEWVPAPGLAVYAATKGAVASMTRGLARDLAPRGITVNNVEPGPVDTDMNPADGPFAEVLKPYVALKRYGHAVEIASLVVFLAGPEAAFITGASLKIDGGTTA
jgi:3-oxoacyl-[acyl-carrier protein] reductase